MYPLLLYTYKFKLNNNATKNTKIMLQQMLFPFLYLKSVFFKSLSFFYKTTQDFSILALYFLISFD